MRPSFMRFEEITEREFVYHQIKETADANEWHKVKENDKNDAKCVPYILRSTYHLWSSYPCAGGHVPYGWSAGKWTSSHLYYDRIDSIIEFRGGFVD